MNTAAFDRPTGEYDQHRPRVPACLVDAILAMSGVARPVVVDLGCGTGLSTLPWRRSCSRVIGVEPNQGMLTKAVARLGDIADGSSVEFIHGTSDQTGLDDCSVDVVAAASAAHWFPLVESKSEILRILRPGGIFAHFYYYAVPLTCSWDLDQMCRRVLDEYSRQAREAGVPVPTPKPVVQRAFSGGGFDRERLFYMHANCKWNAAAYVDYVMTWGRLAEFVGSGVEPLCDLMQTLSTVAARDLGDSAARCTFSYPVNVLRKAL